MALALKEEGFGELFPEEMHQAEKHFEVHPRMQATMVELLELLEPWDFAEEDVHDVDD
jgi:hypothetical protein